MSVLREARKIKVLFAVTGILCIILIAVYLYSMKSLPAPRRLSAPVQKDNQSVDRIESQESSSGEPLSLGRLLGENKPAIPPMTMPGRRPPEKAVPSTFSATPGHC